MHTLAETETSGPPVIVIATIVALGLIIMGCLVICIAGTQELSRKRRQSRAGISPEFQERGESVSFYLMLILGVIISFVGIAAFPAAQDVGEGLVGDSSESSAVQTEDPER